MSTSRVGGFPVSGPIVAFPMRLSAAIHPCHLVIDPLYVLEGERGRRGNRGPVRTLLARVGQLTECGGGTTVAEHFDGEALDAFLSGLTELLAGRAATAKLRGRDGRFKLYAHQRAIAQDVRFAGRLRWPRRHNGRGAEAISSGIDAACDFQFALSLDDLRRPVDELRRLVAVLRAEHSSPENWSPTADDEAASRLVRSCPVEPDLAAEYARGVSPERRLTNHAITFRADEVAEPSDRFAIEPSYMLSWGASVAFRVVTANFQFVWSDYLDAAHIKELQRRLESLVEGENAEDEFFGVDGVVRIGIRSHDDGQVRFDVLVPVAEYLRTRHDSPDLPARGDWVCRFDFTTSVENLLGPIRDLKALCDHLNAQNDDPTWPMSD